MPVGPEFVDELTTLVESAMADRRLTGEEARRTRLGLALAIMDSDAGGADRRFLPAALAVLHRPAAVSAALRDHAEERSWEG
jgi:hypothetical protein